MMAKTVKKPETKYRSIEDDERIVADTLKGDAELRAGLGKRFKNADEFIEHLSNLSTKILSA
ncbi:MAG: hypothetical protein M0Q13_13730 [Methanothrix sp.]|jgi:hypothetical protein|nr:hypothetical protein [Methanothrix sp.]